MTDVVEAGARDGGDADAHLMRHDGSLVYPTSRFRAFLCDLLGATDRTFVAREGAEVVGVLPLLERDGILNSLPFYGSNGGVYASHDAAARALAAAYDELARSPRIRSATVVPNPFLETVEARVTYTHVDERIAQWSELPDPEVDATAVRNVRKAQRSGITVGTDFAALPRLRALHEENIRALGGLSKPPAFFDLIGAHFRVGEDVDLYVARLDGVVVAALLVFFFNRTAEYYVPVVAHAARPLQPLAAILDVALSDAAARGCTRWNWGGTWLTQGGVYRFKRKWGARESRYRYYTQVNDATLTERTPAQIVGEFPGFYVLPFSQLREGATR